MRECRDEVKSGEALAMNAVVSYGVGGSRCFLVLEPDPGRRSEEAERELDSAAIM